MNLLPLASVESFVENLTGLAAVLMIFGIPIIAIMSGHQRKMAEVIHGSNGAPVNALRAEVEALRAELSQLRELVYQQTIALDSSRRPQSFGNPAQSLEPVGQVEEGVR